LGKIGFQKAVISRTLSKGICKGIKPLVCRR